MSIKKNLQEWQRLKHVQALEEDKAILAGRRSETFAKELIETNLKYKNAYCFSAKRVPHSTGKSEIDLIVLTKSQIHIIEIKNWSGKLIDNNDTWIQERNNGTHITHPNLINYNSDKKDLLIDFLEKNNIKVKDKYFSQKVIFMNKNLSIPKSILHNRNVISQQQLDTYLKTQKGTNLSQRFAHSIIDYCIKSEEGKEIIFEEVFKSMSKNQFEKTAIMFEELKTWDRVLYYGGKELTGDFRKLVISSKKVKIDHLKSGDSIILKWKRNSWISLLFALFKWNLGTLKLKKKKYSIKTDDYIRFHQVGEKKPTNILLSNIEKLIIG